MNDTITAVEGVEVGHWSDSQAGTGCTVIVFPEPNVAAGEVRGAAPGSRETALLEHGMRVEQIQAILLTGGSAFGLAAADGVVRALEADGRGHVTPVARV
ncbi:MAG: P1 family peptidase, partial [Acidimicrobiia bacterium]